MSKSTTIKTTKTKKTPSSAGRFDLHAALQERFNGFFLLAFELIESKMLLQGGV
jgi:hypothetical protein